ncbi:MAG: hypothetical protein LLF89_10205 [Spirochaetaceae bacterium]|nr:hypothetical protein [Spirochaetaceae bacterium]
MTKSSPNMIVEKELVGTKAWLALGGIAPQIYLLFLRRRRFEKAGRKGNKKYICTNSQELVFPYREAENKFGVLQPRFRRAIDQLIEFGFLDIVSHGNGTAKMPTIYGLSERWRKYGTPEFEAKSRVQIKRGYCRTREKAA